MKAQKRKMNNLLNQLSKTSRTTHLSEFVPAWQVDLARFTNEALEGRKAFLGAILRSSHPLYLNYSEDPMEDQIPGKWIEVGKHVWRIPPEISSYVDILYRWLSYGNWLLYKSSPESPVWRFAWRGDINGIIESMVRANIQFCIYAFHDNDPWFIFLNPQYFDMSGAARDRTH